ncbi:hypothetical protein V4U86_18120 [Mycobacterium sp. AMU20-3851]|uniref:hypothetical protein n=1 Tax=Mycobacterium sp. AMU20-3851 TaxID=3122055 RepID=UPI0037552335
MPNDVAGRGRQADGEGLPDAAADGGRITRQEFFDHLVPVLQHKGLMPTKHRPGTLREKLFGTSSTDICERHPAHGYRGMFG